MSSIINREPCFWTSTTPGYNTSDRERWIVVDGKRVKEKFPQRGHQGDYDDRRPARGERWMLVVKGSGNIVRAVTSNAAACLDPATGYGQYMRGKARGLGWFDPRRCPAALVGAGELNPDLVLERSIVGATPCAQVLHPVDKPCPHAKAEIDARRARQKAIQDEREAAYRSKEDKTIDALREQTQALVDVVTKTAEASSPPTRRRGE